MSKNTMVVYVVGVEGKGYFSSDGEIYPNILSAKMFEDFQEAYEIATDWLKNHVCNISELKLTYKGWVNPINGVNEIYKK
jgi:hypothetical protein